MKIELSTSELWDLLKEGSTNQREFITTLRYCEFEEFIEFIDEFCDEFDLRGYLNGGVLRVEDTPEEEYIIWSNERISIVLVWLYIFYV